MKTTRQSGVEVTAALKISDHDLAAQGFEREKITDEMFLEIADGMRHIYEIDWHHNIWEVSAAVFRRHKILYE